MEEHKYIDQIVRLILKSLEHPLSPGEKEKLDKWLSISKSNRAFMEKVKDENRLKKELDFFAAIDSKAAFEKMQSKTRKKQMPQFQNFGRYAAAAILILWIAAMGIWKYGMQESQKSAAQQEEIVQNDVLPGTDKARLILADGSVLPLQDLEEGLVNEEEGMQIVKIDQQVIYKLLEGDERKVPLTEYHTIEIPKGGKYQIVLSDGSKVWLNSATTLRYPSQFEKDRRHVVLNGEAYFEVSPDKQAPFTVEARGTVVKVLGTHFNIKAYENEPLTKTTLLEGSVEVGNQQRTQIIVPGQQAQVGEDVQVADVDSKEAVAWKNGYFLFNGTRLDDLLRQLERWYEIEVHFTGDLPQKHYSGTITKDTNLSQVLKMLELSGSIKFEIKNQKLYVMPSS
ncbi:FecR domain-containing protein [Rapidithrix thailandica]|uniref:FecR domain-containing protein n=1 Tax=Rapidithrix thailandica TaxID=413964 RepID=A0AAW9SDM1_9BACT